MTNVSLVNQKNNEIISGKILITGATGNTCMEVIKFLIQKGISVTAALRNPEKDKAMLTEGADYVEFDFARPETWRPADFILVMIDIYTVCRLGKAGTVTGQLERLLGK